MVWTEIFSMQPFLYPVGIRFSRYHDLTFIGRDSMIERLIGYGAPQVLGDSDAGSGTGRSERNLGARQIIYGIQTLHGSYWYGEETKKDWWGTRDA